MKPHDPPSTTTEPPPGNGRLLDLADAARYLATSPDTVKRLIYTGALAVVRLPVKRTKHGLDPRGSSRRVHIDVHDLDALIERNKETRGEPEVKPLRKIAARRASDQRRAVYVDVERDH